MQSSRRQFLTIVAALGGGLGLLAAGCGDDDAPAPGTDAGPGGMCSLTSVNIASNHGHVLVVQPDDVHAGIPKTYDITGSATHSHSVSLTAAHFASLERGGSVTVTSTSAGHTHSVMVSCS